MDRRREQIFVGLFVIVAAGLLLVTVFVLSGAFSHTAFTYKARFPFAGEGAARANRKISLASCSIDRP